MSGDRGIKRKSDRLVITYPLIPLIPTYPLIP